MSDDTLHLASAEAVQDLGRYAARARTLDAEGALRLQTRGAVLAAWVGVIAGRGLLGDGTVLGLRTFALTGPGDLDVAVPLGAVTDRTSRPDVGADFPVPPTRALAPWAALTPPRSGWEPAGQLAADDLAEAARAGIEEVAAAVAERGAAAGLVRDRVWAAALPQAPDIRAGGALAASTLGFLEPGSIVTVHRAGRWWRLTATGGHVLMR
ncbi:MAG: hypothetical protein KBB39_02355 [Phycicoccus sp.]|nr:hypothetical protein [Phycicoccus sp.]